MKTPRSSSPENSDGLVHARKSAYRITEPFVTALAKTGITPTALTWVGFAITLGAAALIATGHLLIGGIVVVVASFFDMLDGSLARHTNRVTRSGAVIDSTLDRISEAALLVGVLIFYALATEKSTWGIITAALALAGSPIVSYVRAKAEIMGIECKIGVFTRAERVITLAVGLLASRLSYALPIALGVIAVLSFVTAGQRLTYLVRQIKD